MAENSREYGQVKVLPSALKGEVWCISSTGDLLAAGIHLLNNIYEDLWDVDNGLQKRKAVLAWLTAAHELLQGED